MSKVYADAVATPEPTDDLTLGGSGDNVIVTAGATLKTNTVKDSGGNTLWTSDGSGNLSSQNSAIGPTNMVLLTTNTSSNAASSSFTSSIDSTYKLYIFKFYDVNPATDEAHFTFNMSIDGGSNYNVTKTTTGFRAEHLENDTSDLDYQAGSDLAQGTGFQLLGSALGNATDESAAGELFLFNPSNTTYVKHYYSTTSFSRYNDGEHNFFSAGYANTTDNIDAIQFKMSSGNMDAVIKMYGVG